MGHKIAEAIIENGQIKYINKKLPPGRLKVHLIYDAVEETSGLYRDIDVEAESRKLRESWERNVHS